MLAIVENELEFRDDEWPAGALEVISNFLLLFLFTRIVFYNNGVLLLPHDVLLDTCL
jgi:hypothetical protein